MASFPDVCSANESAVITSAAGNTYILTNQNRADYGFLGAWERRDTNGSLYIVRPTPGGWQITGYRDGKQLPMLGFGRYRSAEGAFASLDKRIPTISDAEIDAVHGGRTYSETAPVKAVRS